MSTIRTKPQSQPEPELEQTATLAHVAGRMAVGNLPPAVPGGPPQGAVARYREAVLASPGPVAESDAAILHDAMRTRVDWELDVKRYHQRVKAAGDLAERVPILQREAAQAEREHRASRGAGERLLGEFKTVGELSDALVKLAAEKSPMYAPPEKLAMIEARDRVNMVRKWAEDVLRDTCDPSISSHVRELQVEVSSLRSRIEGRRSIIECEGLIRTWMGKVEAVQRGEIPHPFVNEIPRRSRETILAECRHRLAELHNVRSRRGEAIAENQRDEARLGEVSAEIQRLIEKRRVPENMAWSK